SFADLKKQPTEVYDRGLSAVGKWDDEFKNKVETEIDAYIDNIDHASELSSYDKIELKEDCHSIISGGYDVDKIRNIQSEDELKDGINLKIDKEFEILQDAYTQATLDVSDEHVPEISCNRGSAIQSLWEKQGDGKWLQEREEAARGFWDEG
ncbi:MAG: hypothetical protein J5802_00730, partial [Butyrivibrio sp.]|nr:hypothetical protein [Butyrivibrio sp.]